MKKLLKKLYFSDTAVSLCSHYRSDSILIQCVQVARCMAGFFFNMVSATFYRQ